MPRWRPNWGFYVGNITGSIHSSYAYGHDGCALSADIPKSLTDHERGGGKIKIGKVHPATYENK
jgi:hypothetical protein